MELMRWELEIQELDGNVAHRVERFVISKR